MSEIYITHKEGLWGAEYLRVEKDRIYSIDKNGTESVLPSLPFNEVLQFIADGKWQITTTRPKRKVTKVVEGWIGFGITNDGKIYIQGYGMSPTIYDSEKAANCEARYNDRIPKAVYIHHTYTVEE